ncbi:MAG: helicase-related protein [Poseidonia sp.]
MPHVVHPLLKDGVEARGYQLRSLERILSFSSLMVMPTGFGKTAVEWMAMAEFLRTGAQKIVLIAPTTGLVDQQMTMAKERLKIDEERIIAYTGETGPDKRRGLWENATVVMATPQVIRNDAMNGVIDLASVELLILDEAHHATGNHAYAQVGNMYQRANPEGRVLAATASPGSTLRNINEVRTNLNAHNLDLCKRTEPLLSAYDVDMKIHTHMLDLPETLLSLIAPLRSHFNDEVAHLQRQGFMPAKEYIGTNDIERAQQSASRAIQQRDVRGYDAARRVADLRRIHMLMNLMQTQGTKVAQAFLNRAEEEGRSGRKTNRMLALPVIHQLRLALNDLDELHPKAPLVATLVKDELRLKPQGKVLIFTEYRDSVERLVTLLNQSDGIEADAFIGQSSRGTQKGMTQKQQLAQLNRFRSGEINVLVATSVGEEGLDVPAADLVVLYEPVPSAVRAIQRRGRTARQRAGSVHVLIAKSTRDAYVHKASERQEENMHRLMVKLVRQKQLNETFDVDARALDAFTVQLDDQAIPAKAFLEGELERYPSIEDASSTSIETATKRVPRNETVAPPLRPDQLRPREQSSLFAFEGEEEHQPNRQSLTPESVEAVLNAADREISELNEVKGEGTIIHIDHREGRSTLPGYLQGLGFQTRLTQLPCGDIRLSERILIERKSARDLLESVKSGRLLHQCRSLQASAQRPLLLVETGGEGTYSVHPNAVLGALAHITLDLGVPVMMVKGPLEAAHFLGVAAKREHDALQRLHEFVNTTSPNEAKVSAAVAVAKREVESLAEQPHQPHPWLDNRREHLERCFDHTVAPLADGDQDLLGIFAAYSPDIGGLLSATPDGMVAKTGCSQALAARAIKALNRDLTSQ